MIDLAKRAWVVLNIVLLLKSLLEVTSLFNIIFKALHKLLVVQVNFKVYKILVLEYHALEISILFCSEPVKTGIRRYKPL